MKNSLATCKTQRIIIDGFNLMYKFSSLEKLISSGKLSAAMDGLISLLTRYEEKSKKKITVVFDGKKREGLDITYEKRGKIKVYYSVSIKADDVIKDFIKKDREPQMVTVITSDKEILFYVKRFNTPTITSEKFSDLVSIELRAPEDPAPPEKNANVQLNEDEISFWKKLFNLK